MSKETFFAIRKVLAQLSETSFENIYQFSIDFSEEKAEIKYLSPIQDQIDPAKYTTGTMYFQWTNQKRIG